MLRAKMLQLGSRPPSDRGALEPFSIILLRIPAT
jgi:hypothetical protein